MTAETVAWTMAVVFVGAALVGIVALVYVIRLPGNKKKR